jgi:hypothetical protein
MLPSSDAAAAVARSGAPNVSFRLPISKTRTLGERIDERIYQKLAEA